MRTSLLLLLLSLGTLCKLSAQCQIITLPYGQVEIDINRGYKIISTQDGNFVIAGEWNSEAFLLKVNAQGQQLALKKYGSAITGQSLFQDVVEAPDGGFVAVGECNNCVVPNDSLTKVIAIKTDANLNLDAAIGVKKFGTVTLPGGFVTTNRQTSPRIVRTGDTFLMATSLVLGATINWEDVGVTGLSASLATLWVKSYNTGYFEAPYDMTATSDGFIMPVNRAFLPTSTLLKINGNGDQMWIKTFNANFVRGIAYLPGADDVVVIGDRTPSGAEQQAFLMQFDAATGLAQDSLLFGDDLGDFGFDVQALPNGGLLAGIVTDRPNPFGTYATSRIYRIKTDPLTVDCYYRIPNPDNITNMAVRSLVPLSDNGKDFAVTGIRGFFNRTFFHTRRDCELTEVNATICPGDTYILPDGTMASAEGTYTSILTAMNGCDSIVQTVLNFYPTIPPATVSVALCPGETHTLPNGQIVSSAGVYSVTLTSSGGCDSVVQTVVTNLISPVTLVHVSLCPNESYTLPDSMIVSTAGVYDVYFTASNGCDSLVRTTVEGLISPIHVVNVELCAGGVYLLPNGQLVDTSGAYDVIYTAANGCDSIERFVVEEMEISIVWIDVFLCAGSYYTLPNGDTVTGGSYDFPFTDPNGCEGVIKIGVIEMSAIEVGDVDIQNDNGQGIGSISVNNVSGGAGGYHYEWSNGANTASIDSLTFGTYQLTITDAAGCQAVFVYQVGIVGVNDPPSGLNFRLAPNPFSDQVQAILEVEQTTDDRFELHLFDALGRRCKSQFLVAGATHAMDTGDLPAGVYIVQLFANERLVLSRRVTKQ